MRRAIRGLRRRHREIQRPAASRHPPRSEAELLARTEEFNRNAETHWKAVRAETAGREHVLSKPLTSAQDAASILYRMGIVIGELHLGVGHVVLDLGSGSCWLSAWLNRLRCRTISVDVSATALSLGEELFRLDPRQRLDLEPNFLAYDGHTLPVPDASVDRVVCFDSFHHVPNQRRILEEIFRALKPGGRAVFAEPGEGHSHEAHSRVEEEHFGVLENDIDLEDLSKKAREVGFDRMLVKLLLDPPAFTLSDSEYFKSMAGRDEFFPTDLVRESLRAFSIFVLTKGAGVVDSRSPGILRAEIVIAGDGHALEGACEATVRVPVRVRNTGDTLWLHEETPYGGYVALGGHLLDELGRPVALKFFRARLTKDVSPGETIDVVAQFEVPATPGRYIVRVDMVDEGLVWFAPSGSPTTDLHVSAAYADSRNPVRLQAGIEITGPPPPAVTPGGGIELALRLTNRGNTVWLKDAGSGPGTVSVGGHWLTTSGETVTWDFSAFPSTATSLPERR